MPVRGQRRWGALKMGQKGKRKPATKKVPKKAAEKVLQCGINGWFVKEFVVKGSFLGGWRDKVTTMVNLLSNRRQGEEIARFFAVSHYWSEATGAVLC
jgi:hypothetical protein